MPDAKLFRKINSNRSATYDAIMKEQVRATCRKLSLPNKFIAFQYRPPVLELFSSVDLAIMSL
jgi:hypothetical protein